MNIIRIKTLHSTNVYLAELASQETLEEGTTLVAENQTAGKGQRNKSWEAEPGKNITCSILLYPEFLPLSHFFLLSEVISLGIRDTLWKYTDGISIKWPNDIYYRDQKICGILIENELSSSAYSRSIVGIGMNINQDEFRSDAPNPVSLRQVIGRTFDLDMLLMEVWNNCFFWYEELRQGNTMMIEEAYFTSLYRNKGFHSYKDKSGGFQARIERVGSNGLLYLQTKEGVSRQYTFKELEFLRGSEV